MCHSFQSRRGVVQISYSCLRNRIFSPSPVELFPPSHIFEIKIYPKRRSWHPTSFQPSPSPRFPASSLASPANGPPALSSSLLVDCWVTEESSLRQHLLRRLFVHRQPIFRLLFFSSGIKQRLPASSRRGTTARSCCGSCFLLSGGCCLVPAIHRRPAAPVSFFRLVFLHPLCFDS